MGTRAVVGARTAVTRIAGVRIAGVRIAVALGALALGAVALVGCGGADECSQSTQTLSATKKSSLGFSLADVLEGRGAQSGALTWNMPPDWLQYSAESDSELVSLIDASDASVSEQRGFGEECETVLTGTVAIDVATADGQIRATGEAEVTASKKSAYSLRAVFSGGDLLGAIELGSNGRLVVDYEVSGDKVTGSVMAAATEETDMTSRLRQATIARWDGEVGDVTLPAAPP